MFSYRRPELHVVLGNLRPCRVPKTQSTNSPLHTTAYATLLIRDNFVLFDSDETVRERAREKSTLSVRYTGWRHSIEVVVCRSRLMSDGYRLGTKKVATVQ